MAFVIAEPCVDVKNSSCIDACPVDCIAAPEDANMCYIDPNACIDCGACEPACPVNAIFEASALPPEWKHYAQINADYFITR
jgi:NAD-dependent dihydropyrimidine dehydrogenase PreA subunit